MTDVTPPDPALSPDGPADRARIDPPPPKRVDALPVLYVVGFLILAASVIYLWQHPNLPKGAAQEVARVNTLQSQIDALSARVNGVESKPVPATPNLGPLETRVASLEREVATGPASLAQLQARVAALEARPLPTPPPDLRLIEERVAALDARPQVDLRPLDLRLAGLEAKPPVDLKPLESRIAALEGKPPVDLRPLETQVAALNAKPPVDLRPLETQVAALAAKPPVDLRPLQGQVAALSQKEGEDAAALGKRIDTVEAAEKATDAQVISVSARAQMAGKLQGVSAALNAGQLLGEIPGAPPALARYAHTAPPTEAGLRLSFDAAAAEAHRVSQPAISEGQPLLDRMWTRAQQAVTVRRGDQVLVGDPIEGVIAHARQALDAGDLKGAVTALDGLAGPAKAAMADWVSQAQGLLAARAAIGEMAARG